MGEYVARRKGHGRRRRDSERRAGRARSGPPRRLRRHQPGSRLRRRAARTSPTRATTSGGSSTRRGFTSRLYEPSEQFALLEEGIGVTNAATARRRARATCGAPTSPARPSGSSRSRASCGRGWLALRRQGGVPRHVRRAARARPAGADARRDEALRPPVHVAGERRRAVGRAAPLVPELAGRVERPLRENVRAQSSTSGPHAPLRYGRIRRVGDAGRRPRGGRERRGGSGASSGGDRPRRLRARPLLWERELDHDDPDFGGGASRVYRVECAASSRATCTEAELAGSPGGARGDLDAPADLAERLSSASGS